MSKKNVVMILTDQMHKKAMGFVDSNIITPNIDALARDGVYFKNAYSNNPVCGPFRGCLFTGKYTCENRVYENNYPLPTDTKCMAEVFNEAGYDTSFVGKWHLGGKGNGVIPKELRGGFNHFMGYQCYNGFWTDNYFYNEDNEEIGFDGHRTDITTDIGIERLEMLANGDKPFLHVIFYQAPHYPEQPSDEYYQMYYGANVIYPPNYEKIKIINICSMMSELGRETVSAYAAAKGGLKMLTKNIASEYGEYNIQCNGIGPGYIATPQTAPLREDGHPFNSFIISKTPACRWGVPEDLAGPAVFLASDASNFINGHILYVDGGILAYIGKQPK